jgi:hypothetical protein
MSQSVNRIMNQIVLGTIGTVARLPFSYGLRAGDSEYSEQQGNSKGQPRRLLPDN